jgi:hypothetical protein
MRPWHLLPILLPGGWAVATVMDLWPEPQRELLSNPMVALVPLAAGLIIAILIDFGLKRVRPERLPTDKELERIPDPRNKPLIEGVTPAPSRPSAAAARREVASDPRSSEPMRAPAPGRPTPYQDLKVPMPDDPTNEPVRRRR